jgi:hypothetical protein
VDHVAVRIAREPSPEIFVEPEHSKPTAEPRIPKPAPIPSPERPREQTIQNPREQPIQNSRVEDVDEDPFGYVGLEKPVKRKDYLN